MRIINLVNMLCSQLTVKGKLKECTALCGEPTT